jgi:predicted metal-dependent hydrolase
MPDGSFVSKPRPPILPRQVAIDYSKVPRHWLGGSVIATQLANGVNLLFPAGERFFVRSVHHFADRVKDPTLRAQIKGFSGQEGRHAKEHERFFRALVAQGYDVERFLAVYEKVAYGFIEKVASPELRLSTTAACEHFTALLAENALRLRILDEVADPAMRALMLWHAAEEIEHRAVAFDVLREVNASYGLRVAGLAMAAACLGGFWFAGAMSLLAQEDASVRELVRDHAQLRAFRALLFPIIHLLPELMIMTQFKAFELIY